jgi:hypothetical protein
MLHCKRLAIIFCLFFPINLLAQDITGLWKGTLHNDTTGKTLKYEIAISEEKGKLSGYTNTFFIIDDKEYQGVKKVKIRRDDGKIIVQSVDLIANNYPTPPAKGVQQIDMLTLEVQDSNMVLSGPFTTTRTREYRSLTGTIKVQRKADFRQSALIPHLEELGLLDDLSFVPKKPKEEPVKETEAVALVKKEKPFKEKKIKEKKQEEVPVQEPVKPAEPVVIVPAADMAKRSVETIQSVYYKSDSLELTLYDNGEVDGDTVSVLMNGQVIIPMQGLSTRAYRKTIYTKDAPDSIQLVMYAETLGSIPPNTGLLVVHDGENIYEIRFSGDYQKSAAIVFKRRK